MAEPEFHKNNNKWFAGNILKAIRDFQMLEPGETVAIGLSGGIDSTVLLYAMAYINRYSPVTYDIQAFHVETFIKGSSEKMKKFAKSLGIPFQTLSIHGQGEVPEKGVCYTCSRLKKGAIIEFANANNIRKVAFGHHADDFAETFFMNLFEHKRIEGLNPVSHLEKGNLKIIRPMIYLEKKTIINMHRHFELPDLEISCPYEETNKRQEYRDLLYDFAKTSGLHKPAKRIVEAYFLSLRRSSKF